MTTSPPRGRLGRAIHALYRSSAIRYLAVGGTAFVIDFGLLWLLHEVAGWWLWLATGTAFLTSFAFNYTLQRFFSFSSSASHSRSLAKYIGLVVFNTIATIGIVAAVDALTGGWQIGKIIATACTTLWNYLAYRYIVFVDRPLASRTAAAPVLGVPDEQAAPAARREEGA
jgi:putative flippase GtrA